MVTLFETSIYPDRVLFKGPTSPDFPYFFVFGIVGVVGIFEEIAYFANAEGVNLAFLILFGVFIR